MLDRSRPQKIDTLFLLVKRNPTLIAERNIAAKHTFRNSGPVTLNEVFIGDTINFAERSHSVVGNISHTVGNEITAGEADLGYKLGFCVSVLNLDSRQVYYYSVH